VAQLSTLGVALHFMKTRYILLGLLVVSMAVFARAFVPWDKTKPPALPLPVAYQLAVTKLGSATNQFHCVSASISTEFSTPGWDFAFYSTNASVIPRFLCVEFDGTVIEEDLSKPQ
jgi:hypothetical protein